jgi:quercetin dioxygenase-like cupin family protein
MARVPSPRPSYSGPTHIPYERATRHLWGDGVSGKVADWIYVSSDKIHNLVFSVPPAGGFRHSDDYRTIFAADELLYVLEGTMILANPETGEVHRVPTGKAAFFRRDTWHHAFSDGKGHLSVLEFFAPPPAQGTSSDYARGKPKLERPRHTQDEWIGDWPLKGEQSRSLTIRVLGETDTLWRLEGDGHDQNLVGILVSTEHLTVAKVGLLPGRATAVEVHGGDESLYLLEGKLHIRLPTDDSAEWFELEPRDGAYIPEGTAHQYYNGNEAPATFICGIAPSYLVDPSRESRPKE